MDQFVDIFEIYKRGKKRKIISYKNNKEGRKLRNKHEKLLKVLTKFPSSKFSYAYKQNIATKNAFESHLNSILFVKLDIKDFFGSISFDKFVNKVDISDRIKEKIINSFYENSLPLGFVTSPKLSDMYLYGFDLLMEKYLQSHKTLHYSRYCDDILISSEENNFGSLHTFISYIKAKLGEYDLRINNEKTREYDLLKDTSVKFLGLNLSISNDNTRKITISKSFILKTLDIIEKTYYLKNKIKENYKILKGEDYWNNYCSNNIDKDEHVLELDEINKEYITQKNTLSYMKNIVKSRVAYIRYNSDSSYKRFLKKHYNKFGKRWGEIWL